MVLKFGNGDGLGVQLVQGIGVAVAGLVGQGIVLLTAKTNPASKGAASASKRVPDNITRPGVAADQLNKKGERLLFWRINVSYRYESGRRNYLCATPRHQAS